VLCAPFRGKQESPRQDKFDAVNGAGLSCSPDYTMRMGVFGMVVATICRHEKRWNRFGRTLEIRATTR
jgi:hypothetical protein